MLVWIGDCAMGGVGPGWAASVGAMGVMGVMGVAGMAIAKDLVDTAGVGEAADCAASLP